MADWKRIAESVIPALGYTSHKGESGCILVVGGSIEYTGAPYYAGISGRVSSNEFPIYVTLPCYSVEVWS